MQNIIRDIKLFINSEFMQEQKGGRGWYLQKKGCWVRGDFGGHIPNSD